MRHSQDPGTRIKVYKAPEHREQLVGDRGTSVSPVPAWGWLDLLKFCSWRLHCCVEAAVAHSTVCAMF